MRRPQNVFHQLTVFALTGLIFATTLPFNNEVKGDAEASRDDGHGIEVTIFSIDSLYGKPERFFYDRIKLSDGSVERLNVDSTASSIFDVKAETNVLYEYIIYIKFEGDDQEYKLITTSPILGFRPSVVNGNTRLEFIRGTQFGDTIRLDWKFIIDPKNVIEYHLEITDDPKHAWSVKDGLKENKKGSYSQHTVKKNRLIIKNRKKPNKIWVCIRLVHKNGSTQYYHKEIEISRIKTKPPVAATIPQALERHLKLIDELKVNQYYGLSFIPASRPAVQTYQLNASNSIKNNGKVKLDEVIAAFMNKENLESAKCLSSFEVSLEKTSAGDAPPDHLEVLKQAFASNCQDYELNAVKLKIQNLISEDGLPIKQLTFLKNEYATIAKFQQSAGYYVWMELPEDNQLDQYLIEKLQRKLKSLSYFHGEEDGGLSPQLRSAVSLYQQHKNLPVGNIDKFTLSHLGIDIY